jgi:hypothetical protein
MTGPSISPIPAAASAIPIYFSLFSENEEVTIE